MRGMALLLAAMVLAAPAMADEVILEPAHVSWSTILAARSRAATGHPVRYAAAEAPEGAVAPEGTLTWGRLHVGKKSYFLCMEMKSRTQGLLWLDRDGDKDLKEEAPVEAVMLLDRLPSFQLKAVPGEFDLSGESLPLAMNLQVLPGITDKQGVVFLNTELRGEVTVDGCRLAVRWYPGATVQISPNLKVLQSADIGLLRVGGKDIAVTGKLSRREGKIVGTYTATEATGAVACAAQAHLACVAVNKNRKVSVFLPGKGKVHLPKGSMERPVFLYEASSKAGDFSLAAIGQTLDVEEGMTLKDHGTLSVNLTLDKKGDKAVFRCAMATKTGLQVQIIKDGAPLQDQPSVRIVDSGGAEVTKHKFTSG